MDFNGLLDLRNSFANDNSSFLSNGLCGEIASGGGGGV